MISKSEAIANLQQHKVLADIEALVDQYIESWNGSVIRVSLRDVNGITRPLADIIAKKYEENGWGVHVDTGTAGEGYGEYTYYILILS